MLSFLHFFKFKQNILQTASLPSEWKRVDNNPLNEKASKREEIKSYRPTVWTFLLITALSAASIWQTICILHYKFVSFLAWLCRKEFDIDRAFFHVKCLYDSPDLADETFVQLVYSSLESSTEWTIAFLEQSEMIRYWCGTTISKLLRNYFQQVKMKKHFETKNIFRVMYLRDTGSKFWPKFFNDNGRSAEKNAETPVTGVFF